MNDLIYHFVLKTPKSYVIGEISARIENEIVNGYIRVSAREGEYRGHFNNDGTIDVSGELPLNEERIVFEGKGRISFNAIHFTIPTKQFIYELDGTAKSN